MTCSLDAHALQEQLARFEEIGAHALWTRRHPTELTVVLDTELDDTLLQRTLDVERACCPFFALIWDEHRRELTVAAHPRHEPVLDRVASALAA
jgi:hypothetical protein